MGELVGKVISINVSVSAAVAAPPAHLLVFDPVRLDPFD